MYVVSLSLLPVCLVKLINYHLSLHPIAFLTSPHLLLLSLSSLFPSLSLSPLQYMDAEGAQKAINGLHGKTISKNGKPLVVELSHDRVSQDRVKTQWGQG